MAVLFSTSCSSSSNFANGTIDYGIVVSNIEKSVNFYKSIGFVEAATFEVPKEVTGDAGLLNYQKVKIHVMKLSGLDEGTSVKLMQTSGTHQKQNQQYIDSTYGMSYQTIFVHDMNIVLSALKSNQIKVMAKGPVDLTPVGFAPNYLVCVRDPDGNIIEFVGPMPTK